MERHVDFGDFRKVDLRNLWPGESTHFTPWLSQNLQVLGDRIDMELEFLDSEAAAGGFSADILARDIGSNRKVVVENQYGETDHKHLGQLLTYAAVLNAGAIVWIAESIRTEHKSAIDFLNENLKDSLLFFAIEASLITIDDSRPALILNVVCAPTIQISGTSKKSDEITENQERYRSFFQSLIDKLRDNHRFTNARVGQPQNWYTFASENSRVFKYSASFSLGGRFRVELYIDTGDKIQNEDLFDYLLLRREEIESGFGGPLEWERLETKRACRVAAYVDGSIDEESEELQRVEKWAIDALLKMRAVFPEVIQGWSKTKSAVQPSRKDQAT